MWIYFWLLPFLFCFHTNPSIDAMDYIFFCVSLLMNSIFFCLGWINSRFSFRYEADKTNTMRFVYNTYIDEIRCCLFVINCRFCCVYAIVIHLKHRKCAAPPSTTMKTLLQLIKWFFFALFLFFTHILLLVHWISHRKHPHDVCSELHHHWTIGYFQIACDAPWSICVLILL